MNGRAPFGTHPVDFIGALPDSGRVFIRSVTADGSFKDGNFQLSEVAEIREKMGRACNWPTVSDEPTTGTIKPSQTRYRGASRHNYTDSSARSLKGQATKSSAYKY